MHFKQFFENSTRWCVAWRLRIELPRSSWPGPAHAPILCCLKPTRASFEANNIAPLFPRPRSRFALARCLRHKRCPCVLLFAKLCPVHRFYFMARELAIAARIIAILQLRDRVVGVLS